MILDVLGSEPQSLIVQAEEPVVPSHILFPREKLVEVESAEFVACVIRLQVLHKLNLLGMTPTADQALELMIRSLLHDIGRGAEESSDGIFFAGCLMFFESHITAEPLITVITLDVQATFISQFLLRGFDAQLQ